MSGPALGIARGLVSGHHALVAPSALARPASSPSGGLHVARPSRELAAHHHLGRAVVGIRHAVVDAVAAVVAVKAHPVAAVGLQAPLALGPVLQVVGVDHRRRRVDQVVVPQAAAVDRLGRALKPEVPDLRQRLVRRDRAQAAQLLQRRLHRQVRVHQHVVDAARQVFLGLLLAIGLFQQRLVLQRVLVLRAQPHVGLEDAVALRIVDGLHAVPLLEARRERRQVVVVQRHRALLFLQPALDTSGGDAGALVRDRRVQRVELVLHEELPVRLLDHAVAHRHDLDLAHRRAVAHVVERDLGLAEELQQRRAVGRQAGEHEAAIAVDPRRALQVAVGVALVHARALVALGQRDRADLAVEVVAPRVVAADERVAGVALQVAHQLHAAVRAAVVQHVNAAVGVAHHHHRLAADVHRDVVAGVRDLRLVAAVDPHTLEDALHLAVEDLLVGVHALVHAVRLDTARDVEPGVLFQHEYSLLLRQPARRHQAVDPGWPSCVPACPSVCRSRRREGLPPPRG